MASTKAGAFAVREMWFIVDAHLAHSDDTGSDHMDSPKLHHLPS